MGQQLFQLGCERAAVLRGMQAGVVTQVYRGVTQSRRKLCPVAAIWLLARSRCLVWPGGTGSPLQVVHTQAMDQHQHLAGGVRHGCPGLPIQRYALVTQGHGGRQRVIAVGQAVAHHSVQRCQYRLALWCFGWGNFCQLQQGLQPGQQEVGTLAEHLRNSAHTPVDQTGDAACLPRRFSTWHTHRAPHRLVQTFGDMRNAGRGLGCQLGDAAHVRSAQVPEGIFGRRFGHADELPPSTQRIMPLIMRSMASEAASTSLFLGRAATRRWLQPRSAPHRWATCG